MLKGTRHPADYANEEDNNDEPSRPLHTYLLDE